MQEGNKVKLKGFKNSYCDALCCGLGEFVESEKYQLDAISDEDLKIICQYVVVKNIMAGVCELNLKVSRYGFGGDALEKYGLSGKEIIDSEQIGLLPTSALVGEKLVVELDNLSQYTPQFLSEASEFAALSGCEVLIKLGQDLEEIGKLVNKYNNSPVEVLESFGFLDRKCYVYGLNYIDKDDQKLLKDYEIPCIFSPISDGEEGLGAINLYNFKYNELKFVFSSGKCYNIDMLKEAKVAYINTANLMNEGGLIDEDDLLEAILSNSGGEIIELDECERRENIFNKKVLIEHEDYQMLRDKVKNIAKGLKLKEKE